MASHRSFRGDRLAKLVLTDFGVLRPLESFTTFTTSYARMLKNLSDLTSWGALTSVFGLPFDKVSGFQRKPTDAPDIRNPSDLYPGKELKLLLWGSPHGNPSSNDGSRHGPRTAGEVFKTQAFEAMAWLCPRGTVIMTFPSNIYSRVLPTLLRGRRSEANLGLRSNIFEGVRPDEQ